MSDDDVVIGVETLGGLRIYVRSVFHGEAFQEWLHERPNILVEVEPNEGVVFLRGLSVGQRLELKMAWDV